MILATRDDIDYPHIDWECSQCGMVYCSSGLPDDNRCMDGHSAQWRPVDSQMEEYIDLLESIEVGDGVLFAGKGPAPLMGPVAEVGDSYIITESIDSPARKIRWDSDELKIEQASLDGENELYDRVYHVDDVEVLAEV
jgi:preprotein translocase subunit YajC